MIPIEPNPEKPQPQPLNWLNSLFSSPPQDEVPTVEWGEWSVQPMLPAEPGFSFSPLSLLETIRKLLD